MPLVNKGTISVKDIQLEYGDRNDISFSQLYRGGGLVADSTPNQNVAARGPISMSQFYGASASATNRIALTFTIGANTNNYDVYTNAVASPSYVTGITDVTLINNAAIGSASVPAYALLVPASFNSGDTVNIVNNSFIYGLGGQGGAASLGPGGAGSPGGNAIYVNRPVTITNNGTIGAGGGGGGAGNRGTQISSPKSSSVTPGGGGGGGAGGGAGGAPNGSPSPGPAAGAGGAGGGGNSVAAGPGGAGGALGASGTAGTPTDIGAGPVAGGAGGASANYITGNPFVTWAVTGTRSGGVA